MRSPPSILTRRLSLLRYVAMAGMVQVFTGCSTIPDTFSPSNPLPPESFSHQPFHRVLANHVRDGMVDYPGIAADHHFPLYLHSLSRTAPQQLPTPDHRLAFWINAYNALAIKGILDGLSPDTLTGRYTFFIAGKYVIGGERLNLYDLEHHLLIPDFQEPRIHFAIVCASQSCPKLQSEPYAPMTLDRQLTASAREFINDPARNRFDRQRRIAYLSKIFDWFSEDFERHSGSLLAYVAQFVTDEDLAADLRQTPYTITYLDYDWSLNGTPLHP